MKDKTERENVKLRKELVLILRKVKKNIPEAYGEVWDEPLTGDTWKFDAVDFIYLIMEIMESYQIQFRAEDVENYKLNSMDKIECKLQKHKFERL